MRDKGQEGSGNKSFASVKSYRDLTVWQEGMRLADYVYDLTEKYPSSQLYSLVSQTERSALSIPSNIAEGNGRGTRKDYRQFLIIARGSLNELETQLFFACKRKYITKAELDNALSKTLGISKMLNRMITLLKAAPKNKPSDP